MSPADLEAARTLMRKLATASAEVRTELANGGDRPVRLRRWVNRQAKLARELRRVFAQQSLPGF